jgi:hypothetical protein
MSRRIIRASEIGQYAFCARAWWLNAVEGAPSSNTADLARGTAAHAAHGRAVIGAQVLPIVAVLLIVLAIIVLLR